MLNKRVKSLLVTGLLVLGMAGQAFADPITPGYPDSLRSSVDNVTLNKPVQGGPQVPNKEYSFQKDNIQITVYDASGMTNHPENTYQFIIKYNANLFSVEKLSAMIANGGTNNAIDINMQAEPILDENGNVTGWEKAVVYLQLKDDLSNFEITYALIDDDNDGVPNAKDDDYVDPEDPNNPEPEKPEDEVIKDPAAGDANTIALLGGAAVGAGVLLIVLNRKKEDEE